MVWIIENHRIANMCFFCLRNLEYDVNFPIGLLSQLRLVIENNQMSLLDDPSSEERDSGEAKSLSSLGRAVIPESPLPSER